MFCGCNKIELIYTFKHATFGSYTCKFDIHRTIFIIFGRKVTEKISIQFPTLPN